MPDRHLDGTEPQPDYRLHGFAESGNAYKAALMLQLCGADWAPVHVDFFAGAARSPEFLTLNPMGEAPVLEEAPDATGARPIVTQSGAILTRLARRFERFGGADAAEADEILRWLLWDNHKLTANIATERFMRRFLAEEKRNEAVIGFLAGRRRAALKVLEARLAEQDWVALPTRPTIADLSCCGYLFWLDQVGETASDWPAVARWLDHVRALEGWAAPETLFEPAWPPAAVT